MELQEPEGLKDSMTATTEEAGIYVEEQHQKHLQIYIFLRKDSSLIYMDVLQWQNSRRFAIHSMGHKSNEGSISEAGERRGIRRTVKLPYLDFYF